MNTFPNEKTRQNRKPSAVDMVTFLQQNPAYPPAQLVVNTLNARQDGKECDALLDVRWSGCSQGYTLEIKTVSAPAALEQAAWQVSAYARVFGLNPMVMAPYLSEEALLSLQEKQISGIDLCGNCVILAPSFTIWRSGAPNQYRESRPIRNPYSGDSSIIVRCFLLQRQFATLGQLRQFALTRTSLVGDAPDTLLNIGTVSKVVGTLEDELVLSRSAAGIQLLDPRGLLDRLKKGYKTPSGPRRISGKTPLSTDDLWSRLAEARTSGGLRSAATGLASAGQYGVLSTTAPLALYVDDLSAATTLLEVEEARAFANIQLVEARKNLPFFDTRLVGNAVWASPIQTWLELAQSGPREQQAALVIEDLLLREGAQGLL